MHDTSADPSVRASPRLLVVAHGTASPAGSATTRALVDAIRAARPAVTVDLAFLDVVTPRLSDVLTGEPTVLVPLLLSTGYHVESDIPTLVAPYPNTRVMPHLGPHPLVVDALLDRLHEVRRGPVATTVLVAAGSTQPAARSELELAADRLAAQLGRPVPVLTMADDVAAELGSYPRPIEVATYLLAEGQFVTTLQQAAAGLATVAPPLGTHPRLVELVWARYDAR